MIKNILAKGLFAMTIGFFLGVYSILMNAFILSECINWTLEGFAIQPPVDFSFKFCLAITVIIRVLFFFISEPLSEVKKEEDDSGLWEMIFIELGGPLVAYLMLRAWFFWYILV